MLNQANGPYIGLHFGEIMISLQEISGDSSFGIINQIKYCFPRDPPTASEKPKSRRERRTSLPLRAPLQLLWEGNSG